MAESLESVYAQERARLLLQAKHAKHTGEYETPVFGAGPLCPTLMLIGEAPGTEEARSGCPFVGKAGKNLDALLSLAGIARERVFVTNAVKFRPTSVKARSTANRTPLAEELALGLPVLQKELALVQPALVATLGNTPLKALCLLAQQEMLRVGDAHGQVQTFQIDGMLLRVFPLYHPASVIYNPALLPILEQDITRLGDMVRETEENRT